MYITIQIIIMSCESNHTPDWCVVIISLFISILKYFDFKSAHRHFVIILPAATSESHARVLHVPTFETRADWKVTDNSVSILRTQVTAAHSMLGVADTWTGLCVYDLRCPTDDGRYERLYQVGHVREERL